MELPLELLCVLEIKTLFAICCSRMLICTKIVSFYFFKGKSTHKCFAEDINNSNIRKLLMDNPNQWGMFLIAPDMWDTSKQIEYFDTDTSERYLQNRFQNIE